jgi:uncharacterized membrane protein YfcA
MSPIEGIAIIGAGAAAGAINTIVGSGSLVTFPTLVLVGYSPLIANVANTVGLVPGSAAGVVGYRRELVGQRNRVVRFGATALAGGITGAAMLLLLPSASFSRVVPYLILAASLIMALQPQLSALVARHRPDGAESSWALVVLLFLTASYGGYFGAAQSVLYIALLATFVLDDLQRLNALKNVLACTVNGVAALLFISIAHVEWAPAILIAAGSILGSHFGAALGRRLPANVLRVAVVAIGLAVSGRLLLG